MACAIEAIVKIHIYKGYRYALLSFLLKCSVTVWFDVIIWVYNKKNPIMPKNKICIMDKHFGLKCSSSAEPVFSVSQHRSWSLALTE